MVSEKQSNNTESPNPSTFLEDVAQTLLDAHGQNMVRNLVLLPNSRGAHYLRRTLKQTASQKALLLPTILGMDSFIERVTQERIVTPAEANLVLYQSFRKIKNPDERLADFLPLGQILLSDFEEIIRHGRNVREVFGELKNWTATGLGFADFLDEEQKEYLLRFSAGFEGKLSENRKRFVELWSRLPAVFEDFTLRLKAQGLTTSAMAYRSVLDQPMLSTFLEGYDDVYFVGFGNLSATERAFIESIRFRKELHFCWDIQPWYSEVVSHEVNRLFARLKRNEMFLPSILEWEKRSGSRSHPTVVQISCKGISGMAQWISRLPEDGPGKTAVVATDTGLVHALVANHSGPDFPYNITMGYALAFTPEALWVQKILKWVSRPVANATYDLPPVLEDPHFKSFFPDAFEAWTKLKEKTHVFSESGLKKTLVQGPTWLWPETAQQWISDFLKWLETVAEHESIQDVRTAAWNGLDSLFRDLVNLASLSEPDQFGFQTLIFLFPNVSQRYSIDIKGSESHPVQVLGLYESRLLDFERIVVAPAEEGGFPSGKSTQSFIPENIRKAFRLPTRLQKYEDEIYQFYRLTHRSKEIFFLTGNDPGSKRSRVIDQIEFGHYFPFTKKTQDFGSGMFLAKPIEMEKNEELQKAIAGHFTSSPDIQSVKSLSPSSLHSLLVCPLRFYYQKLCGLQEPETVSEVEMSAMDFGNWIHNSLQKLLSVFGNQPGFIAVGQYEEMRKNWPEVSAAEWERMEGKTSVGSLDSFEIEMAVGKIMADRFFDFMSAYEPHRWLKNEWTFPPQKLEAEGRFWSITGRADILLETRNRFLILDLKTGGFKEKKDYEARLDKEYELPIKKIKTNKDLFQMLLYNRMAGKEPFFQGKPVRSALFYLANPNAGLVDPFENLDQEGEEEVLKGLERLLANHLSALANPALAIGQTDDLNSCLYCSYTTICQR